MDARCLRLAHTALPFGHHFCQMTPAFHDKLALDPITLLGQLLGYGFSVTLAAALCMLVWRSRGAGWGGRATFAACAMIWSVGGLLRCVLLAAGFSPYSGWVTWIECLSFAAAAVWPLGLSMLWSARATLPDREVAVGQWLVRVGSVTAAALIVVLLTVVPGPHEALTEAGLPLLPSADEAHMWVGYNALALMLAGAILISTGPRPLSERIGLALMFCGPVASITAHWATRAGLLPSGWEAPAAVLGKQSVSLIILGGLLFLGRFRAADRFAKLGLRILSAWVVGALLAWAVMGPLSGLAALSIVPRVVFAASLCGALVAAAFLFGLIGRVTDRWVERQVFGKMDPSRTLQTLRDALGDEESIAAVLARAERFVTDSLQLEARLRPVSSDIPAHDESVRVRVAAAEPYVLVVGSTTTRRTLVSGEVDLLHRVAEVVGRRLESLEREAERLARSAREAGLMHQLVQAELRALRAQINPHFLFNSLNTIAALVHQEPTTAETMVVGLARIFRHVLTQSDQPFASVAEEIQFLKAYLEIEQVRFGERLKVQFQVTQELGTCRIPALILQPLVENAIKHGLAPKLGECRLVIEGTSADSLLVLRVRDDGVGTRSRDEPSSSGIGMRNIRERLSTLYGAQARLEFESKPQVGTCVTLYLPLSIANHVAAYASDRR